MVRIGHGFDVHRFGGDKPLMLGGVEFAGEKGLIAHSDGDVVLHAICDALLGALARGDIGHHFPDTSEEYKDANSVELLKEVFLLVKKQGYQLSNLDITIIAQTPKISDKSQGMRGVIAAACDADFDQINIKATTTEQLGYIGRKEGIAVHAVCLLLQSSKLNLQS